MNLDRDLRDALRPLGGDPVADARRVLAALPAAPAPHGPGRGPGRGLPPIGWWLLGAGLALGLLGGSLLGRAGDAPAAPEPKQEEPVPEPKKPAPQEEPHLVLMAFGELAIEEPKRPREVLAPNQYMAAIGTIVDTGASMAGLYVYPTDARVRLAPETNAAVLLDRVVLRTGRLWLANVARPTPVRIEAELCDVLTDAAEVLVERGPEGVTVTVLYGEATVHTTSGGARRLGAKQRLAVDRVGIPGGIEAVSFDGTVTGWMAPMILLQQDETELRGRIAAMIAAYVEGEHRDAAVLELRRLGGRSVPRLYDLLDTLVADAALRHRTAALIRDVAEYAHRGWLLAMLERGDEETRAAAFQGLRRVGGFEVEDEAFWRAASSADRDVALARWRRLLQ